MKAAFFANMILTILPSPASAAVDLLSGGYTEQISISINEMTLPLRYRSRSTWLTNLGYGWCGPWNAELNFLGNGQYEFTDCRSRRVFSPTTDPTGKGPVLRAKDGSELRIAGETRWVITKIERLKFNNNNLLVQRFSNSAIESFDYDDQSRLRLWKTVDGPVTFIYSGPHRQMAQIKFGPETISLKHDDDNLVELHTKLRHYHFSYDDAHNLIAIKDNGKVSATIRYDRERDLVSSTQDVIGCLENFRYDSVPSGLLLHQQKLCQNQGELNTTSRFNFTDGSMARIKSLERKSNDRNLLYRFDELSRLATIDGTSAGRLRFFYDSQGNLIAVNASENQNQTRQALHEALRAL